MTSIWRSTLQRVRLSELLIGPALALLIVSVPLICALHCHLITPPAVQPRSGAVFFCHLQNSDGGQPAAPISFSTLRALAELLPVLLPTLALPLVYSARLFPTTSAMLTLLAYQPPSPPPRAA